jgi:hypothetical protein
VVGLLDHRLDLLVRERDPQRVHHVLDLRVVERARAVGVEGAEDLLQLPQLRLVELPLDLNHGLSSCACGLAGTAA